MKIEVGKWYKTRGGYKVFVAGEKDGIFNYYGHYADRVVIWNKIGRSRSKIEVNDEFDLIEEWKEPKTGVVYANIWLDDGSMYLGAAHHLTRASADASADSPAQVLKRVGRVRVEWKEGQFDE